MIVTTSGFDNLRRLTSINTRNSTKPDSKTVWVVRPFGDINKIFFEGDNKRTNLRSTKRVRRKAKKGRKIDNRDAPASYCPVE